MSETSRELLFARLVTARDRLAVLSARTSNPDLLHRIGEAGAVAAALDLECRRGAGTNAGLQSRVSSLLRQVDQLAIDFNHDAVE